MPADTQQILDAADKLGQLVAQHPAVAKYKEAQKLVSSDPDASRLLNEFNRLLETLARNEQSGLPITDAQRTQLEHLQSQIMSHIKIKALNLAHVEFYDLLRKVTQAIHRPLQDTPAATSPGGKVGA
jgi:cell fate (sporulation/competence/biofilm development) regulator YlbF (YheA/YmcA/DUF963 family)